MDFAQAKPYDTTTKPTDISDWMAWRTASRVVATQHRGGRGGPHTVSPGLAAGSELPKGSAPAQLSRSETGQEAGARSARCQVLRSLTPCSLLPKTLARQYATQRNLDRGARSARAFCPAAHWPAHPAPPPAHALDTPAQLAVEPRTGSVQNQDSTGLDLEHAADLRPNTQPSPAGASTPSPSPPPSHAPPRAAPSPLTTSPPPGQGVQRQAAKEAEWTWVRRMSG